MPKAKSDFHKPENGNLPVGRVAGLAVTEGPSQPRAARHAEQLLSATFCRQES